jgi:hypothetical protein
MSAYPDRLRATRLLVSALLSVAIILAIVAASIALNLHPGEAIRDTAAAFGAAALVHLLAAFAIEWTRRIGDRDNQPLP